MSMTRIYRFHQYGGPEVLQLESHPTPQPSLGEVRVHVQAPELEPRRFVMDGKQLRGNS